MSLVSILEVENYSPFYNCKGALERHILKQAYKSFEASRKRRESIVDVISAEAYQQEMRARFIHYLGGLPYDNTELLNARITGIIEEEHLRIEKVIFESRPKVYVTANLYIPKKRKEPCGAVLFQMGHANDGKFCDSYQQVARTIASAGLIVMSMDPYGQGERLSYYEKQIESCLIRATTAEHQYVGNQCVLMGDSLARYFIADAMRAVDYLQTRPEVDATKIGATGCSGGGTATCHLMVCDPRIAAAAPATFVSTLEDILLSGMAQDAEQIWNSCMKDGFDHYETLLCFAPKPTLLLTVDSDFFPIEGAEGVMETARKWWRLFEREDKLRMVTDRAEHSYTDLLAAEAASFFARELNGEVCRVSESWICTLPEKELFCTKTGLVKTDFPDARFAFDENLQRLEAFRHEEKEDITEFIKNRMYENRKPAPLYPRRFGPMFDQGGMYENGIQVQPYLWFPQHDLPNYGLFFSDYHIKPSRTLLCLWPNGTDSIENHLYKIRRKCVEGTAVFVVDLAGMGKMLPNRTLSHMNDKTVFGTLDFLNKYLMMLGDSLCALRLFDLSYAISLAKEEFGCEVELYAEGNLSLLAGLYQTVYPEMKTEVEKEVPGYLELIQSRYYEDYDIAGVLLPGIGRYL